ncbi:MAG: tRNA uridine-5-carboxymethylaminomethyl(34) synthesis enzyme MnmG [Zymomonas mobilis subsp. pomaceae]|uniref:tRNA uridine-5-carboxymethylaminomethyl(34) synthesis enzyme MnmG n=1 Tax=Zymomonas mobilis TaxID=542 RepID=UPI0009B608E4|nr:tRNA uridine-5-carboxymethylaminomethyl(34) synthesis enzyme MnmG [Zymomonas mobilis]MDX5949434.1 tRNA uridine-5-carboxymethylaminomethyl(34) synthesis enzyme MnmG [Zymomonas mobilis subsp. pomaceae]
MVPIPAMKEFFDIVVIGGGHAGCEAAAVSARTGAKTALVTMDIQKIGAMSCNPAIGGLGKGHLVREIDAWDGLMARAADYAAIHYRMLNRSKGSAVQGPRVQADRRRYQEAIQNALKTQENLSLVEGTADSFKLDKDKVIGLYLEDGRFLETKAIILATGTFLDAWLFCGEKKWRGGRIGEQPSISLAQQLRALDLPLGRLKTGTPARLDGRTIDWSRLQRQPSDEDYWTMASYGSGRIAPQIACALTRSNQKTHDIIRAGLDRSPLFSGAIEGRGPRYCPSIEDKIIKFGDRDGHQIFLEPEGLDTPLIYPNGISTSLPEDVQQAFINSIEGLEKTEIVQSGYAVEYEFIDPRSLTSSLALKKIKGLFCAGQINGTTGYEEAAAQGLVAGISAACYAAEKSPPVFSRRNSYIGVMIDDLVLQGVTEPYRMLTARAEYRLGLRADNAVTRLSDQAEAFGALGAEMTAFVTKRREERQQGQKLMQQVVSSRVMQSVGANVAEGASRSLFEWLRFPAVTREHLEKIIPDLTKLSDAVVTEMIDDGRYAPYLERQDAELARLAGGENTPLPDHLNYADIAGLSNEMVERFSTARPADMAAASRVRGVTPAALAAIWIHAKKVTL